MLGALAALSGCAAAVASASGAASGYSAAQERSVTEQSNDMTIKSQVVRNWDRYDYDMAKSLGLDVYEGRVLVTGRVPNPDWREQAVQLAWKVAGVKEVYNEVEVGPATTTGEDLNDTWITTRLRNEILWDGEIRSLNYTIRTSSDVIYLIGAARNQTEIDRVTNYARNIPDVKRVVSYVKIRVGAPEAATTAQPAGQQAPAPGGTQAPATGGQTQGGATGDRIEVKPLQ
jgi:osmotically-inducible protein OsmY